LMTMKMGGGILYAGKYSKHNVVENSMYLI